MSDPTTTLKEEDEKTIDLPEFTEEENDWCVVILSIPKMKPKRAGYLFVYEFDRFQKIAVDRDTHPDNESKYYSIDKVVKSLAKEFNYFRSDSTAANYKEIQAKRELYNEIYRDFIELLPVFDIFELTIVLQEMYSGIKEYNKNELNLLKEAANLRGVFYQPKVQREESGLEESQSGWHTKRAPRRADREKRETETELSDS